MLPNISRELKLLLSCLASKVNPSELDSIDWDVFISLAERHKMDGMVKPALSGFSELVPEHAQIQLDSLYKNNIVRSLRQLQLMKQIGDKFNEAGIDHLFIKGAHLARYYQNISDRHAGDVDILIHPVAKLWDAVALLRESGFQRLAPTMELNEAQAQEYLRRAKDVALYSPKHEMCVEVHTRLIKTESIWPYTTEEIFKDRCTREIQTYSYPAMSTDLESLYIMLHGGLPSWYRLKWLFDAHLIFKGYSEDDFRTSYQFALHHGLERAYLLCMQMLMICFDMPTPDWLAKLARQSRPVQAMCNRSIKAICSDMLAKERNVTVLGALTSVVNGLQQQMSMKAGMSHIVPVISSRTFDTRNWETLSIPPQYHFLYKPLAPFLLLILLMKKKFKF